MKDLTQTEIDSALASRGYDETIHDLIHPNEPLRGYRAKQVAVNTPVRIITTRAFMKRINQLDRIAIRNSTDDIVIDIHEDLKSASNVDLDDDDVSDSIAYLTGVNLLDNTELTILVSDGTESIRG